MLTTLRLAHVLEPRTEVLPGQGNEPQLCSAFRYSWRMLIDDTDFEELLALLKHEDVPFDLSEARQAIENFVDLVELVL